MYIGIIKMGIMQDLNLRGVIPDQLKGFITCSKGTAPQSSKQAINVPTTSKGTRFLKVIRNGVPPYSQKMGTILC